MAAKWLCVCAPLRTQILTVAPKSGRKLQELYQTTCHIRFIEVAAKTT